MASPDRDLIASPAIVATADSGVLDRCGRWFNLARDVVERSAPEAWMIDLSSGSEAAAASSPRTKTPRMTEDMLPVVP